MLLTRPRRIQSGMITLRINGMHCAACVRRVQARLQALPDTRVEKVEVGLAQLESSASDASLLAAVTSAGFTGTVEHQ